jgi:hypothetical protein
MASAEDRIVRPDRGCGAFRLFSPGRRCRTIGFGGDEMPAIIHVIAKLVPWDDPAFVKAYEHAREAAEAAGCCPDGLQAATRVQHDLRVAGYPNARIEVERSVEEALEHVSHWTVRRDG